MKAYKASYNGECKGFKFEVGKTYTHQGPVSVCKSGFHFCKKAMDTLNYYNCNKDFVLFEIEAEPIKTKDDKSVTDKIKILRKVPKKEYWKLLKIKVDKNGLISYQEYADGTKYWWLNGELHREDGPAFEGSNGTKSWRLNGFEYTEKEFNEKTKKVVTCEGKEVEIDGIKYKLVKT